MRRFISPLLVLSLAVPAGCARAPRPPADVPPAPAAPSPPPAGLTPSLRYDGLYRAEEEVLNPARAGETAWAYLRFYPEGTVISTSQSGPPPHPLPYFTIADEKNPSGTVTVRDDGLIAFSLRSPGEPAVDYVGIVRGDYLYLRIHSHINGYRGEKLYEFVPGLPVLHSSRTGAP